MLAVELLFAQSGQVVSGVVASANSLGLRGEIVVRLVSEDAVLGVLARLIMNNSVLEVEVSLGNMLLDDGSINTGSARVSNPYRDRAVLKLKGA